MDENPYRSPQSFVEEEPPVRKRYRSVLRELLAGLFVGITHGSFVGASVAVVLVLMLLPFQGQTEITPYSFVQYALSASILGAVCGLLIGATTGVVIAATSRWTQRLGRAAVLPIAVVLGLLCGGLWAGIPWLIANSIPSGAAMLMTLGVLIGGLTGWFSARTLRRALSAP